MPYVNIATILPDEIKAITGDVTFHTIRGGKSGAGVFRAAIYEGGREVYLKVRGLVDGFEPGCSLLSEMERLTWLYGFFPVPKVEAFFKSDKHEFLLLSALKGRDASAVRNSKEAVRNLTIIVEALKKLHAIPTIDCPFIQKTEIKIEQARKRLAAGFVDPENFDEERRGRDPRELFEELLATQPPSADLVVTHGDFCLPNIVIDRNEVSGLIDVGRLGIADRYQDLALLSRSLGGGLNSFYGTKLAKKVFELYGIRTLDEQKLRFFQMLDEFF